MPAEHTSVDELRAFAAHVRSPVFEDEIGIFRYGFYAILVIVFDVLDGSVGVGVAESVAEVHTVAVHFVFA